MSFYYENLSDLQKVIHLQKQICLLESSINSLENLNVSTIDLKLKILNYKNNIKLLTDQIESKDIKNDDNNITMNPIHYN